MAELASAPGLMALEAVVLDSLWEKLGLVLEIGLLVSAEWVTHEAVVSGSPDGLWFLCRISQSWNNHTDLCPRTNNQRGHHLQHYIGETVGVETAEPTPSPELVAVKRVLSDSLWETFKVSLETGGLVSAGWVSHEVVLSGSPGKQSEFEQLHRSLPLN